MSFCIPTKQAMHGPESKLNNLVMNCNIWVYLSVQTCEVFLCFVATVRVKALVNEDTLLRTHCRHDVSWAAQTGKHLLRTQNVSEQNQKHFLCSGHKTNVARAGKRGNICVSNNVSATMCPRLPGPLGSIMLTSLFCRFLSPTFTQHEN